MSQRLIILFDQQELDNASWSILDETGQILQHDQGELPMGGERFAAMDIDVFLPCHAMTLLPVSLPNVNAAQRRQALTYAVEDFIADDIDNQHIAFSHELNHEHYVAVMSRQLLRHYLAVLAEKDLIARTIQSDIFLLPVSEDAWHIAVTRTHVRVRQSRYLGFCADRKNASALITRALESCEKKPTQIHIENFTRNEFVLLHDGVTVDQQFVAGTVLDYYCVKNPIEAINLLQGEFHQSPPFAHNKKLLNITKKIVAAWAIILCSTFFINSVFLHFALKRQRAQIADLYQQVFPQASSMVEPQLRFSRELGDLSARTQGTVLQQLLQQVGTSKNSIADLSIGSVSYRDQILKLQIRAKNIESMQALAKSLENAGLSATLANVNATQADLTIKRKI